MLYHTSQKTRSKRRRSDSGDDGYLAVEVGEPLRLHDEKRQRFSAPQDWKSQAFLEAQIPQWLPTPPSMDVDTWPESPRRSWQQHAADGHLHHSQPRHHNHHMALSGSSYSAADCHRSHGSGQNQGGGSQAAGDFHRGSDSVLATTLSLSPPSDGRCNSDGGGDGDGMDDCELDPSSEYYQINLLLNQLHRERALRQRGQTYAHLYQ